MQITEQDVNDVIAAYRTQTVETLRQRMPPPAGPQTFIESVLRNLPADVLKQKVNDTRLTDKLRIILKPVFELYGRNYELVIVKNKAPLMMSDSGVVLVITTGMIEQATSDDELIGYAAHEIGHEYFVFYSVESRHLMQTISEQGNEIALRRRLAEILALIELQCDAFAAISLARLNRNPIDSLKGLERAESAYSNYSWANHPPVAMRRKVIEGVAPQALQIPSTESETLRQLKAALQK